MLGAGAFPFRGSVTILLINVNLDFNEENIIELDLGRVSLKTEILNFRSFFCNLQEKKAGPSCKKLRRVCFVLIFFCLDNVA